MRTQVEIKAVISAVGTLRCSLFIRRAFASSCSCDRIGDLGLDGKDIIQLAVVTARPQMSVGAGIDELHIHANLVG